MYIDNSMQILRTRVSIWSQLIDQSIIRKKNLMRNFRQFSLVIYEDLLFLPSLINQKDDKWILVCLLNKTSLGSIHGKWCFYHFIDQMINRENNQYSTKKSLVNPTCDCCI